MKLTKKLEADILKLYHKYWDAYLNGKMKTMFSLMDKNCHVIGSGMGEVFKNKKDAVKYYAATADQIAGLSEMRNRNISVASAGNNILVTEESDFYVLMEGGWTFYGQGRFSTLFGKTEKKWLIIQQHGSVPDSRTGGGEQVNTDKIKEENLRLKDAIKRRTIELEQKNRELEIEASLERVRAVAMGMTKPDDLLNVCEVLFKEFHKLGFDEMRNAMINIHNDEKGTFVNYDYSDEIGRSINHLTYNIHPVIEKQIKQIRSANDAFSETSFSGKDLEEWKKFRQKIGEKDDQRIDNISALYYFFYSIGTGSIGISTFNPIGEEKLTLLKRFRNVFSLSYQRYSDIAQAEAQAREAKIEASLERVRAVAMSMHKSDDLLSICEVSFKEFQKLGFDNLRNAIIHIPNDEKRFFMDYDYSEFAGGAITKIEYGSHPIVDEYLKQIRKAEDAFFEVVIKEDQLNGWKDLGKKTGQYDDSRLDNVTSLCYYLFSIGIGDIGISTFEPIDDSQLKILKRFRNVFDLAYRRYNDIALAEEQARETQIQLALERVRARTMAMQKSEELSEVAYVLFRQFKELDKAPKMITIGIMKEDQGVIEFWVTDWSGGGSKVNKKFDANIDEPILLNKIFTAWKEKKKSIVIELTGENLQAWVNYRVSLSGTPDENDYSNSRGYVIAAFFSKGILSISTYDSISDETTLILERFAGVFDQTYTRFNDLKQAEAQAREAQIEAALEKVRSRTMGMQKSEELKQVIRVVYEQFVHLKINVDHAGFVVDYTPKGNWHFWIADEQDIPSKITHPYFESVWANQFNGAKEKGADFFATNLNFEEKNKFYDELLSYVPRLPEASKDFYLSCPGLAGSTVLLESVGLYIENFSGIPYSDEENNTLMRFGKVFQQTYTRFLDLQKAEAQAREAQIEVALERVRARTMAMQNSNELVDTSTVLFHQLKILGIDSIRTGVAIMDEFNETVEVWSTSGMSENFEKKILGVVPARVHPMFTGIFNAWKNKEPYYYYELKGDELKKYYRTLSLYLSYPKQKEFNEREIIYTFFFPEGSLNVVSHNVLTEEECNVVKRFAKVFGLVYTRFLDLQKAEAQAREAKIEAALERVRAKAMAMHTSNDLSDTMGVLFTELPKLNIHSLRCGVVLLSKNSLRGIFYAAATTSDSDSFTMIGAGDMAEHPVFMKQYESWLNNENYFTSLSDEDLHSYYKAIFARLSVPYNPREHEVQTEYGYYFAFSEGMFYAWSEKPYAEDEINILNRFKAIIDLTFRRYLDLQKAEAQAREAQIELALERVRARTMAMHNSEELSETAHVLFRQFKELGQEPEQFTIGIINEVDHVIEFWHTWLGSPMEAKVIMSIDEPHVANKIYTAWKEQNKSAIIDISGIELREYNAYRKTKLKEASVDLGTVLDEEQRRMIYIATFSKGTISISTHEPRLAETIQLLERFAGVFDLTYTRFLDLQKAEAQAREAKIETALEKVRSNAMAMNSSEDLAITVDTFFTELNKLNIIPHRCGVGIVNRETRIADIRATAFTKENVSKKIVGQLKLAGHPVLDKIFENWKLQQEYHPVLRGNEILEYYKFMNPQVTFPDFAEDEIQYGHYFHFKEGGVFVWTDKELKEEDLQIFRRYTSVLSLTYRRYSELKEAEAQARKAKIEASLERVRSKAMAMHSPNDLSETVNVFFKELKTLGIIPIRCGVGQIDEATRTTSLTTTTSSQQGESFQVIGKVKQTGHPVLDGIFDHWKLQKEYHPVLEGENIKAYYNVMNTQIGYPEYPEGVTQYGNNFFFKEGFVFAWTENLLSEEELIIFRRFTSVLSLTYRRYMDLKEAEEQAKEAKIEASLEKVRSKTMAMQSSDELADTAAVVFQQLINLGIEPNRIYITIIKDETGVCEFWITDEDGSKVSSGFKANLNENDSFKKMYGGWKENKKSITIDMQGEELKEYFRHLSKLNVPFKGGLSQKRRIQYIAYFSRGFIGVASPDETKMETLQLLERFAAVFNLTYTRFNDLKQAEAQNKIIQAENDRKTKELEEARQLQLSLLPKAVPKLPHLEIAVYMKTATEVGGDYYDFNIQKNGVLNIGFGDATGHGLQAGTMITLMKGFFTSDVSRFSPQKFLEHCNGMIRDIKLGRILMSFSHLRFENDSLLISSAGMPPVYYHHKKNNRTEEIIIQGLPLGAMGSASYKLVEKQLNSGDTILLLTDGLPEQMNSHKVIFDYSRVLKYFDEIADNSPNEIINRFVEKADGWMNGQQQTDDITFVVIRIK